ncbi:MAG TPA: discoidin domain-containing protein [Pseudomonadales bacterium]|nr:discoidin domain-containing protein [Pseudomonadales bacterium]
MNSIHPQPPATLRKLTLAILACATTLSVAEAAVLTDLPGITTSASSCYTGCGKAQYDHSNILDKDYGASGNTGLNTWNSGYWGGWVEVDFKSAYLLDRVELYGIYAYGNPYTLSASSDGTSWVTVGSGAYHQEPALSQPASVNLGGIEFGGVHDVQNSTLTSNVLARYLRYTVSSGSPHWGYMAELRVEGHAPPAPVPTPAAWSLLASGLGLLGALRRRQ